MPDLAAAPLKGVRIVEFTGLGPGPFACMMLADMGAEVIRVDRPGGLPSQSEPYAYDFLARGRRSICLDLKQPAGMDVALRLIRSADGLVEGYRPGVMERLGLGPDVCHAENPKLVYGRMTGWGQDGPLALAAGHDLNYIAITGALWSTGEADRAPTFPSNLLGDFGGGGMYLAFGMVTGLLAAARTGQGDVVDAAICDGTSSLMAFMHGWRAKGLWTDTRAVNELDGGAPWYAVYECADGKWITVAAMEPQFWACLLSLLGLDESEMGDRSDPRDWPKMRERLSSIFKGQQRSHWVDLLEGTDACFAPVLSPAEAREHPHIQARQVMAADRPDQPMPAPRFARRETPLPPGAGPPGADGQAVLEGLGYTNHEIKVLEASGAVASAQSHSTT